MLQPQYTELLLLQLLYQVSTLFSTTVCLYSPYKPYVLMYVLAVTTSLLCIRMYCVLSGLWRTNCSAVANSDCNVSRSYYVTIITLFTKKPSHLTETKPLISICQKWSAITIITQAGISAAMLNRLFKQSITKIIETCSSSNSRTHFITLPWQVNPVCMLRECIYGECAHEQHVRRKNPNPK